jgi:hypothetical protein
MQGRIYRPGTLARTRARGRRFQVLQRGHRIMYVANTAKLQLKNMRITLNGLARAYSVICEATELDPARD